MKTIVGIMILCAIGLAWFNSELDKYVEDMKSVEGKYVIIDSDTLKVIKYVYRQGFIVEDLGLLPTNVIIDSEKIDNK